MISIRRLAGILRRAIDPSAWAQKSFAQEGEDLIVNRLFENTKNGFYIDVGSHHPFKFSNTYLMYLNNWRGLCIDPLPGSRALFERWRPKDIAVEMGVSLTPSQLTYHMFNEPALNTFDPNLARERDGISGYHIVETRIVETNSLASIISANIPSPIPKVDLLSVDVEGFDLQVLQSNDWALSRPSVIIAECLGSDFHQIKDDNTAKFLLDLNYNIYAKTGNSIIFTDSI